MEASGALAMIGTFLAMIAAFVWDWGDGIDEQTRRNKLRRPYWIVVGYIVGALWLPLLGRLFALAFLS